MGPDKTDQPGLEVAVPDGLIVDDRYDAPIYAGDGTHAPIPVFTEHEGRTEKASPRTICGLRPRYFWIGLIVAVVVVAAAVGGGVGGSLGSRSHDSSPSTSSASASESTPTSTTASTSTPTSSFSSTPTSCPSSNGTTHSTKGSSYIQLCATDLCSGYACAGTSIPADSLKDFTTSSLDECVGRCVDYNSIYQEAQCKGVSWDEAAPESYNRTHRCFLKNDTSVWKDAPEGWTIISAVLESG